MDDQIPAFISSTVKISGVSNSISQTDLRVLLSAYGNLQSLSPGAHDTIFAIFDSPRSALAARKAVNGQAFCGSVLSASMMLVVQPPEAGNVFIGNLPDSVTTAKVESLFPADCVVLSSTVSAERSHAFVQFLSAEMADAAIAQVSGKEIAGRVVTASHFHKKPQRWFGEGFVVYVSGFPESYTEEKLSQCLEQFDPSSVTLLRNAAALVSFRTRRRAWEVVNALAEQKEQGFEWQCTLLLTRDVRETVWRQCNVIVENLPLGYTQEELVELFGKFGHILSSHIHGKDILSSTPIDSETANVCYQRVEAADCAVLLSRDLYVQGRPVAVTKWRPRNERLQGFQPFDTSACASLPCEARRKYTMNYLHRVFCLLSSEKWADSLLSEFSHLSDAALMQLACNFPSLKTAAYMTAERLQRRAEAPSADSAAGVRD